MKATGITRRSDDLGRVVIPIELRRVMDIKEGDSFEIFTDDDKIILRKYEPGCVFCGSCNDMIRFHCKNICVSCATILKRSLEY